MVVSNTKAESSLSGKTISGGMVDAYNALLSGFSTAGYANPTASASPGTVTASTSTLSVSDPHGSGDADLTYTWNVTSVPSGATPPSYNSNGKSTTVTFHAAGNYTFLATIADGDGFQTTAPVSVTVNQTATSITISPSIATLSDGQNQGFAALVDDQFGVAISSPSLTWSVNSGGVGGTINQSGTYTAPFAGAGTDAVKVASGQASATAMVTVTSAATGPIIIDDSQPGNGFSSSGNWTQWGGGYDNTDSTAPGGNGSSTATVVADAIRINRVGPYYADDSDGSGIFGDSGGWTQWNVSGEGYDNTHSTVLGGNGSAYATWTFTNLVPGQYEVWATWVQASNRATNSPFSIYDNSTFLNTVLVNQAQAPSGYYDQGFTWSTLGESFSITSGTLIVKLTNGGVASNLYVVADAIRINRVGSLSGIVSEPFVVIGGTKRPAAQGPQTSPAAQPVIGTVPPDPSGATAALPVIGSVLSDVYGWVEYDPASPTPGLSGLASVARPGKGAGQPAERPPQGADLRGSAKLPLSGPVLTPPYLERVFDELISRKTQPAILARWNLFSAD